MKHMGETLIGHGKYGEALQAFDKAIQAIQTLFRLIHMLRISGKTKGITLKTLGRIVEANAALDKARELGSND